MKRSLVFALCAAALAVAASVPVSPRPAAAAPPGQPSRLIPKLFTPSLSEGIEPIPVDQFGNSPDFNFLVFEDDLGFHVLRVRDRVVTFSQRIQDVFQVGFSPFDDRMYLVERSGTGFRLRFIDPFRGTTLLDQHFLQLPEIRTNTDGTVNLTVVRNTGRAQVLLFDA